MFSVILTPTSSRIRSHRNDHTKIYTLSFSLNIISHALSSSTAQMAPQSASFAAASSSLQQLVTAAKSQLTSLASDMDKLKLLICSLEERLHSDKQKHLLHCDDNIVSVPPELPPIFTTTPASTPSIIPSPILSAAAVAAPVLKLCKRPGCGRHLPTPSASNDPYLMRMLHPVITIKKNTSS